MALNAGAVTGAVPARTAEGPLDTGKLQALLLELTATVVDLVTRVNQGTGGTPVQLGPTLAAIQSIPALTTDRFTATHAYIPILRSPTGGVFTPMSEASRDLLGRDNPGSMRDFLELGGAATREVGVSGGVAAFNDPRFGSGGGPITVTGGLPRSVSPEDFGAPDVSGGVIPGPSTADDAGVTECFRRLSTEGANILFKRWYGITSTKVATYDREGLRDGMNIRGVGDYTTGLQALGTSKFNAIEMRGTTNAGGALHFHPYLGHFGIKTPDTGGKGIFVRFSDSSPDDRMSHATLEKIRIVSGDDCIHVPDGFNIALISIKGGSKNGHVFNLEGGNATTLVNCYASTVGRGKAGYRIVYMATMIGCTGLDDVDLHSFWFLGAGRSRVTGTSGGSASSTRLRLDATDLASSHELPGLWLELAGGFRTLILNSGSNATDGRYVDVLTPFPGGTVANGTTYAYFDAESGQRNVDGLPINRRFQGTMIGCNIELWGRDGIKFFNSSSVGIDSCLFYNYTGSYDSCIHFHSLGTDQFGSKISRIRFDTVGATRRQPLDIIQARGNPSFIGEGIQNTHWTYQDMQAGAAKQYYHVGPRSIQYPTGFPTTNPGNNMAWLGS